MTTKTTTIFDYLELYSGPAFFIHLKYSIVIKIVVVTLMYGVFIPAVYLWAFIALLVFYIVEKYQIFYYYKKPPMHNKNLCLFVMENMQWAPVLGYIMGFWAITNNQMWNKDLNSLTYSTDIMDPQHSWKSFLEPRSWTQNGCFYLWGILFTFVFNYLQDIIDALLYFSSWDFKGFGEFDIQEDNSSFHHYIKGDNLDWYVSEYEYAEKHLMMDFDNQNLLKELTDHTEKDQVDKFVEMVGLSTFDMLCNPEYFNYFYYVANTKDS